MFFRFKIDLTRIKTGFLRFKPDPLNRSCFFPLALSSGYLVRKQTPVLTTFNGIEALDEPRFKHLFKQGFQPLDDPGFLFFTPGQTMSKKFKGVVFRSRSGDNQIPIQQLSVGRQIIKRRVDRPRSTADRIVDHGHAQSVAGLGI